MFDSFNDLYPNTPPLAFRSHLESEINLFKIDVEEEDKQKAREFRCSLNEIHDNYSPEILFPTLGKKIPDSFSNIPFAKYNQDLQNRHELKLPPRSNKLDLPGHASNFQSQIDEDSDAELEDLDFEGSFISSMNKPNSQPKSAKNAQFIGKKNLFQENKKVLNVQKSQKSKPILLEKRANCVKQKPLATCKCKKSKCLRLYCECFAKGLVCGVDCNCTGCHNSDEFSDLRELIVQETLEKNPFAFKSKYKKISQANDENENGKIKTETQENNKILHSRGCNCSKTGCVKKYCECFNAGTGCSRLCRCSNCKNESIQINDKEVKVYYDRVLRRRKKQSLLAECFQKKCEIIRNLSNFK